MEQNFIKPIDELLEASNVGGFYFSVVVAIYNKSQFLKECIESVISQTIGFSHIQLILVNDGSTDNSLEICKSYEEQFPDNVVVVNKANGGVSSARNAGLKQACGTYVNFLDADDMWSSDSFERTLMFFEAHPEVNMASSRYVLVGAKQGDHRLNFKFKEDRVIDLRSEYDKPQLSSSSSFFRREAITTLQFCERLSVSEDTLFVNTLLLRDLRYGVMSKPVYYYRQLEAQDSAIDTMKNRRTWYFDTTRYCSQALFDLSNELYGKVLSFIQFTVMYDMQWRLNAPVTKSLSDSEVSEYREIVVGLLQQIDDPIIVAQKSLSIDRVAYALCLKYGLGMGELLDGIQLNGSMLESRVQHPDGTMQTLHLRDVSTLSDRLIVDTISIVDETVQVNGFVNTFRFRQRDIELHFLANNHLVVAELFEDDERPLIIPFADAIPGKTGFRASFLMKPGSIMSISSKLVLKRTLTRNLSLSSRPDNSFGATLGECGFVLCKDLLIAQETPNSLVLRRFPADADNRTKSSIMQRYRDRAKAASSLAKRRKIVQPWSEVSEEWLVTRSGTINQQNSVPAVSKFGTVGKLDWYHSHRA